MFTVLTPANLTPIAEHSNEIVAQVK
jgi:hypothetical protein